MVAPLLLGTGMLLRSIKANAAYIIPRVGLLFVLLWLCWFSHSVVQRTLLFMQQQARGAAGERGCLLWRACTPKHPAKAPRARRGGAAER